MPEDTDQSAPPPPPPPPWHGPFAHHSYSPPPDVYSMPGAPQPGFYPITVGRALSLAFSLYRYGWRTFIAIGLTVAIPIAIINGIVQYVTFSPLATWQLTLSPGPFAPRPDPRAILAALPVSTLAIVILGTLLAGLFFAFGGAALTHAIFQAIGGQGVSARRSLGVAFRRLPSLIGLWLIVGLGTLGIGAFSYVTPLLGSITAFFGIVGGPLAFVGLIPVVAVAFALIFVMIRVAFALEALIIEELPVFDALGRSWHLLAGSMLRLLGWMIAFTFVVGLIAIVFEVPAMIAAFIISPPRFSDVASGLTSFGTTFAVMIAIVQGFFSAVLQPLVLMGAVLLYLDIRFRRGEQVPTPGQATVSSQAPVY